LDGSYADAQLLCRLFLVDPEVKHQVEDRALVLRQQPIHLGVELDPLG
jgi:hypothetical protein